MRRKIERVALTSGELAKALNTDLATATKVYDQLVVYGQAAHNGWELHATVSGNYADMRRRPSSRRLPAPNKPY